MTPATRGAGAVLVLALAFPIVGWGKAIVPLGLPDFTHAGYAGAGPAEGTLVVNVRDEGARGDGRHDDSAAFLAAVGQTGPRIVLIPAGRYRLQKVLRIARPGVVLRGEGPENTTLWFPRPLSKVVGSGKKAPGGSWSWSGGFLSVEGGNRGRLLGGVKAPAARGDTRLAVSPTAPFHMGQAVRLVLTDDAEGTLGRRLHADAVQASPLLRGRRLVDFSCRVVAVGKEDITLDRPLRVDVRPSWSPQLFGDEPTVHDVGIENLTVEFPDRPYAGHHNEPGFNAISFQTVSNSWVRNIVITNADAGVLLRSETKFCDVRAVTLRSTGHREVNGLMGHHAFLASDLSQDNVFTDFDIGGRYIHDLCVSSLAAGNVFMKGRGADLTFDHHRKAPYENLFTDLDAGKGSRLWLSGGDEEAGPPSGAREVFWNITAAEPLSPPQWAIDFTFAGFGTALLPTQPINLFETQRILP